MSITLPPLLPPPEFRPPLHNDATVAFSLYLHNCKVMYGYATAYATLAVEHERASRVPMTLDEINAIVDDRSGGLRSLIRAVEAHHGIGVKP